MATDTALAPAPDVVGEINKYDFRTEARPVFKARKGLDAEIVSQISDMKGEPEWMRKFRLDSLEIFNSKPMPRWGGKIAIRSGTARIAIVPAWDDDVPMQEQLPPFPGAQVQLIVPEQGSTTT